MDRGFRFEQLERRRLLAADCCLQALPEMEVTTCEVAAAECGVEDSIDSDESAIVEEASSIDEVVSVNSDEAPDANLQPNDVCADSELENVATPLDLSDGMDGYFGALNADNPSETFSFTAESDGQIDIVVASSFNPSQASVTVTDSSGNLIQPQSEGLDGFTVLTFEAREGENYQLAISTEDATCSGHYQVTVGFEAFADQHADTIGSESSELALVDGRAELEGRLENAGDIDTFRFTAPSSGEVTLQMQETVDQQRVGLGVSVQDAAGNILAEGKTNERVQISFDVEQGQEYFVSIAATHAQKGTYQFGLELEPAVITPDVTTPTEESDEFCAGVVDDAIEDVVDDVVGDGVDETTDVVDEVADVSIDESIEEVVDDANECLVADTETPVVDPPQEVVIDGSDDLSVNECVAVLDLPTVDESCDLPTDPIIDATESVEQDLVACDDSIDTPTDQAISDVPAASDLSGLIGDEIVDEQVNDEDLVCEVVPPTPIDNGGLAVDTIDGLVEVEDSEEPVSCLSEQQSVDKVFAGFGQSLDADLGWQRDQFSRSSTPRHRGFQRS